MPYTTIDFIIGLASRFISALCLHISQHVMAKKWYDIDLKVTSFYKHRFFAVASQPICYKNQLT